MKKEELLKLIKEEVVASLKGYRENDDCWDDGGDIAQSLSTALNIVKRIRTL